jgi:hypothetical protein
MMNMNLEKKTIKSERSNEILKLNKKGMLNKLMKMRRKWKIRNGESERI